VSRAGLAALAALLAAVGARTARAGENDLVLGRLGEVVEDEAGAPVEVVGSSQDFRSLASELGVVMAPRLSAPADTIGLAGFQLSADLSWTRVHTDRRYWRALAGSPDPSGDGGHGDDFMPAVGVFARKGIWLPAPSFEIGLGAVHLLDSRLWAAQAYAKLAVIEGYDLLVPSFALRASASRMLGSEQLGLTVLSLDASASRTFAVAGVARVTPYAGWAELVIRPRSAAIDATPAIDARIDPGDRGLDFEFPDQRFILRHRGFAGVVVQHHVISLTLEAALALRGRSRDDRDGTDTACDDAPVPTGSCDARDRAGQQLGLTATLALDF